MIASKVYNNPVSFRTSDGDKGIYHTPKFTASIDTALTLVPEGLRGSVSFGAEICSAQLSDQITGMHVGAYQTCAATPALALCAAALKARQQQNAHG